MEKDERISTRNLLKWIILIDLRYGGKQFVSKNSIFLSFIQIHFTNIKAMKNDCNNLRVLIPNFVHMALQSKALLIYCFGLDF